MTKQRITAGIALLVITLAAGLYVIARNFGDDEMNVYVALLDDLRTNAGMDEVAFISAVTTCQVEKSKESTEMVGALIQANAPGSDPRPLERLSSLGSVVAWNETKRFHELKTISAPLMASGKRVLKISRVGFDKSGNKAVLCWISSYSAGLVYFEKQNWRRWKVVDDNTIWVSELSSNNTLQATFDSPPTFALAKVPESPSLQPAIGPC